MTGYPGVAEYMLYFVLSLIAVTVLYVFYLFWLYIKSTSHVMSGKKDSFEEDPI